MPRLSMSEIQSGAIRTPGIDLMDYDRSTVTPGIVHLGIGAFHRAHMAA